MKLRKLESYRWISDLQITAGLKEVINRPNNNFEIRAWHCSQLATLVVQNHSRYSLKQANKTKKYYRQTWNQSHEMIKPDSNLSFPYVDSWLLTGEPDSTDLSLGKRKNESNSEWDGMKNLGKPWERNSGSSSQHNHNPWIPWTSGIKRPILAAHESGRFEFWTRHNDCTVCTMILQPVQCVQLLY